GEKQAVLEAQRERGALGDRERQPDQAAGERVAERVGGEEGAREQVEGDEGQQAAQGDGLRQHEGALSHAESRAPPARADGGAHERRDEDEEEELEQRRGQSAQDAARGRARQRRLRVARGGGAQARARRRAEEDGRQRQAGDGPEEEAGVESRGGREPGPRTDQQREKRDERERQSQSDQREAVLAQLEGDQRVSHGSLRGRRARS